MPEHTIAENLTRLQNATTAIGNAITAKGGTVGANDGLEEFAADIDTIPSGGGHIVKITTIANATVTLSNQSDTYINVADNNGVANFEGVAIGTYTVTATYDDATSNSTSITITDHTATEDSFATLTLSASTNTIITVTNGTITKTLSYTGTPIVQYVSLGTWDISASIEGTTITRTINVSTYINENVYLAPPSAVVTRVVDFVNNTSTITGDVSAHPVYAGMTRCNVADDGTINAYYGDVGYTENGSNGQVMVKVPKFYYKFTPTTLDGVHIRVGQWEISDRPIEGFSLHPAFLAADGVTELDYFMYGAFEAVGQDSNGTYSSSYNTISYKLGSVGGDSYTPIVSLTRATARSMASNRGTGWYSVGVKQTMAVLMLFAVEYGFNSQKTLGWGIVSSSITNTGKTTSNTSSGDLEGKTTAVNYRGIENIWGNVFSWIDGLNLSDRTPYVCDTFTFVDDTSTGYTQIAFNFPASNDFISALGYDANNDWILLPSEASNATADSAIGDYVFSSSDWRIARLGGNWSGGTNAGAFYWTCTANSSSVDNFVGARLMYIPQTA